MSVSVVPATVVVTVEALLVSLPGLFCEAVFDQSSIQVARRALQDRVQNQQSEYLLAPVTSLVLVEVSVMAGGVSVSVAAVFCPVTVVVAAETVCHEYPVLLFAQYALYVYSYGLLWEKIREQI